MSKYYNRKTRTPDGIVFDSKKEAMRWNQLKLMEKAGIITDLQRQVKYELIPKQDGERACCYKADFVYHNAKTGELVVEDTKGYRTEAYKIKRKLMLFRFGIKITEV